MMVPTGKSLVDSKYVILLIVKLYDFVYLQKLVTDLTSVFKNIQYKLNFQF